MKRNFYGLVDVSKGPVERSVIAMVRLIAPDYLSVKEGSNEKPERKEFIYYQESWEGKDFLGRQLNPVSEHFEGRYERQYTKPHINEHTGEVDYMQLDPTKAKTIYYIPYSKKAVDDIISKSANTDKDSIVFTIRFGSEDSPTGQRQMPSRNQFSYEQFVWPWDQVYKHNFKPSVQAYMEWVNKEKSKDGLSFEPT